MDLTMGRIRQIRDVILTRRAETQRGSLETKEVIVRYLAGTIQAAAGNKRGMAQVSKFRLTEKEAVVPTMNAVARQFPVDTGAGGLISAEDLAEARSRLVAV